MNVHGEIVCDRREYVCVCVCVYEQERNWYVELCNCILKKERKRTSTSFVFLVLEKTIRPASKT